jgi:protein-S-isoprenylcysteine O-methyltransferase Ste14
VSQRRNFWMRWRVRVGYPVAVIYWLLAEPTPRSILIGVLIAATGLAIRASASGHLRKYEQLCTTGPYARTRNPLYFGSAFLAAGFVVAGHSWAPGAIVTAYFAIFYYAVMRNEESDLHARYGRAFDEYAAQVPLFLPRIFFPGKSEVATPPAPAVSPGGEEFSWPQYARNREYQALIGTIGALGILWLRMLLRTYGGH